MGDLLEEYRSRLRDALGIINDLKAKIVSFERAKSEPIAIIGMGCRFPGGATDPDAFFRVLESGTDAVREIPPERWPKGAIVGAGSEVRWAALIDCIDSFDANFFGISPRETVSLDPQQRMLLEVTWEAIENAGVRPDGLVGSRAGVFVGICRNDYEDCIVGQGTDAIDAYFATGNLLSTAAGRLSYWLGLQGPCLSIDTACSSSLVAAHLACESLRNGESDLALVGGVSAILSPVSMTMMSRVGALSPDGRCKTFDARANGYVRGEGCGVLVLKRLSDARRDGDRVRAVILGSAVNQDGRSSGLTTPNVLSQEALLRHALASARIAGDRVGYVETHGTGTPLGDPIEVAALRSVLGAPRRDGSVCLLGAVKTNIGHLEGAAGVAGLIKAILCLERRVVPRNLHQRALNPRIEIEGTSFSIPTKTVDFVPAGRSRVAGVSSFGISGTNAHVILEEAPAEAVASPAKPRSAYLLPISAKSDASLAALAQSYAQWLVSTNESALPDIVYTASVRRTHHPFRMAVVGATRDELAASARGEASASVARAGASQGSAPKVVFVFPGQGSQWLGMGRKLLAEEPVFRKALEDCGEAIAREAGFSVIDELLADESRARLGEIDVVQPLLFAIAVSLSALWRSWGVEPSCVVGHSMGEVAAAHVAGMLTLADAAAIICRRSRLLRRISGRGAMALVELSMADAARAILGREDRLGVAVNNGPRSTVLSGDPAALEEVLAELEAKGIFCRRVKVDVASHSPQVDPLRDDLRAALRDLRPQSGAIPMRSTVTAEPLRGEGLVASYWWENLRAPVRFSDVTLALMNEGHALFVEMSPHPILLPSIEENLKEAKVPGAALASMRRGAEERRAMLEALGALYVHGYDVDWSKSHPEGGRVVSLPAYAWQHERFWIDTASAPRAPRSMQEEGGHPLLGLGVVPSTQPSLHVWEQWLSATAFPYLADHRVQGQVVFPGAGYVELGLAAASRVYGESAARLESISFEKMLALPEGGERLLQVVLIEEGGGRAALTVASREATATEWVVHASGTLRVSATSSSTPEIERREAWQARCPDVVERRTHYERMAARGLDYGKRFQRVEQIFLGQGEWLSRVCSSEEDVAEAAGYVVHPTLLDACFQSGAGILQSALGDGTFVPVSIAGVRVFERPGREVWVHGRMTAGADGSGPSLSMVVRDDAGRALLEVTELRVRRLSEAAEAPTDPFADCVFEISWRRKDRAPLPEPASGGASAWLSFVDRRGLGARVAELLRARGDRCVEVSTDESYARIGEDRYHLDPTSPEQWREVLQDAFGKHGCRGVIHCAAIDGACFGETTEATLSSDLHVGAATAMRLAQALVRHGFRDTPKLYLLTRGAQAVGERVFPLSVSQSTLWGFGRSVATEQPDLGCVRIDLSWEATPGEAEQVVGELLGEPDEDQIALRPEGRYVARLVRARFGEVAKERREPSRGRPYQLDIREPGVLEKLAFRPIERRPPGRGEVEIEVEAAGLNFLDVMKAMGIYPGMDRNAIRLGGECAGRIVSLGEGVTGLEVGQEVIASAPASFASHVTAPASSLVRKPPSMSFEEAASIPGVFMTVYWALHRVGRLRRGERILIHSATGGTGLAAMQYARAVGAEIFATAGSEDKRALLRSMGVEHVMDSRTLAFADEVLSRTGGRGVDVVLNSLSGEGWRESLRVLAPYGRFLDLSKKDIYENTRLGLLPFRKSLSLTAIDLAGMAEESPEVFGSLLREVMERFGDGTFQPEPLHVFSASAVVDAFRLMAQARHVGKIVVRMKDPSVELSVSGERPPASIRADGTYLVTGGLGGLGLSLSQWMVENGARHLALLGRGAPNDEALASIARMERAGARVSVLRCDVSKRDDVLSAMAEIDRTMPPLRGVVHAAGALSDRTLPEMTEAEFFLPMESKVFGGWHLHEATRSRALDFFVAYSSAAGMIGSPGQSNYAAANTFLDGLCQARAAEGLVATSIQWGAFAGAGLAAASENRGRRVASRGSDGFELAEGNELFGRVLAYPRPEVGLLRFNARQWVEFNPHMAGAPYFSDLVNEGTEPRALGGGAGASFREALERAERSERAQLVEGHLVEQLGRVLRMDPGRIDRAAPFTTIGVDSLMSLELRNRLEASLGLKLSAALLFTHATPKALSEYLIERLFPAPSPGEEAPVAAASSVGKDEPVAPEGEGLVTEDEDESSLVDKLEAFEEYLG